MNVAIPINEMQKEPGAERKRKILIVEDEFVNREILIAILDAEYEIIAVGSGAEAEASLLSLSREISLVLLDLNLPDRHGLDILREMKENPLTAKIPVIVLTSDKEAEVESLNIGAIDFIPKPYPIPKVVQARVKRTIDTRCDLKATGMQLFVGDSCKQTRDKHIPERLMRTVYDIVDVCTDVRWNVYASFRL